MGRMMRPAVFGGIVIGLGAGLPILGNCLSCFCCAPGWGGGLLAAYLLYRAAGTIEVGSAAAVGAVAGCIGAAIFAPIRILEHVALGPSELKLSKGIMRWAQQQGAQVPPEFFAQESAPILHVVLACLFLGALLLLFSTIGGAIGGLIWRPREGELPPEAPYPPAGPGAPPSPAPPAPPAS